MSKKIIALILAIATILGCTAFAWEEASPKAEADYAKELLYALDIIDVVTDKGYAPDQVLTRAELADAVLGLNSYRDTAAYGSCFADVNEATPHADAIATLLSHGVIAKDINFNPEATAKFEHAVKMIVYTLGYGTVTEAQGGWLEPILNVARNSGVTKGVSVTQGTDLTADMLAVLLYNSLDCEMLKRKSLDEFETIKGETLLLNKFGIKKTKGIVTANAITTLTSPASAEGRASINWHEYEDADQILAPYLGMEAIAYYTEDYEEIVFGYPTERNYVKTILADDILPNASGFNYENIYYREVKESGSARSTKVKVDAEADVIYNGKAFPEYTVDDFKIDAGKLVLIDSDDDNIAEVVLIEESVNYVVDSVNITDATIYDVYGETLDLEDVDFLDVTDMYDAKIDISALTKWNVLSVLLSKDGEYVKIVAYNDPVSGEVEKYWTEDGETFATIDGDTFKVAPSYLAAVASGNTNAKQIAIGQAGTYYLDGDEKIAAASFEVDSAWQYAYLIKAVVTEEMGVQYRLLMDESGFKWYEGAEKVRIDEVTKEDEDRKTFFDDANEDEDERKTVPQLIKIQMNGQGQIKKIDTIAQGSKETEDNLTRVITTYNTNEDGSTDTTKMREYWSIRTARFGMGSSVGVLVQPSSSFVVSVPANESDIYIEDAYEILTGHLTGQAGDIFTYNAYDADWAGVAKAAVIYGWEKVSGNALGTLAIVHSIETTLNADDEIVRNLRYYTPSGTEGVVPIAVDFNGRIAKGDIIGFFTNYNGEVDEIRTIFDVRDKNFNAMTTITYTSGDGPIQYLSNQPTYFSGNVIIDKQGSYIKTLTEGIAFEDATLDMPMNQTQIYSLGDAAVMLYDSVAPADERITKISSADLNKYIYGRNKEARVILYSTYSQLRMVLIYI